MTGTYDKPTMKLGAQVLHEPLEDELQFIAHKKRQRTPISG